MSKDIVRATQKAIKDFVESEEANDSVLDEAKLKAIALLAHGVPVSRAASAIGVSTSVLNGWLGAAGFMSAVEYVSSGLNEWHKQQLGYAASLAWEKITNLLSMDLSPSDPGFKDQVRVAENIVRQVIGTDLSIKEDLEEEEVVELNVHQSSVDLIARRVMDLQSKPEAESKTRSVNLDELPITVACHPNSVYGEMMRGESGWYICHVCGKELEDLFLHTESAHALTYDAYCDLFGVDRSMFSAEYVEVI